MFPHQARTQEGWIYGGKQSQVPRGLFILCGTPILSSLWEQVDFFGLCAQQERVSVSAKWWICLEERYVRQKSRQHSLHPRHARAACLSGFNDDVRHQPQILAPSVQTEREWALRSRGSLPKMEVLAGQARQTPQGAHSLAPLTP